MQSQSQRRNCLKPCVGVHADVQKTPVEIVQVAQNMVLTQDYLYNYTNSKDDPSWIFLADTSQKIMSIYI